MAQSESVSPMYRKVEYNDCPINIRLSDNWVSLTDMWKSQGSPPTKRVNDWINNDNVQPLLRVLANELNTTPSCIYETRKGKGGGTFGIQKLAMAYAEYLNAEFHSWALGALVERIEEDANPELAYQRGRDRAIAAWKKQGKSDTWIEQRLQGIETRFKLTDTLKAHGVVEPWQYAQCTDAINQAVLGNTAKKIRQQRGLSKSISLRDTNSRVQNAAITLAEALADEDIETNDRQGYKECRTSCEQAGNQVKRALNRDI